ncbi:unnamed protein product [Ascophyllum nodosum]
MTGKPESSSASAGGGSFGNQRPAVNVKTEVANPVKTQRELDELFDKLDADSRQLPTEETTGNITPVLETALMSHQLEGVAWMVQREHKPDPSGLPPFWETRKEGGKSVVHNTITSSSQPVKPASVHGGILSDEMGLGKTLQVISLILARPPRGESYVAKVNAIESNKRQLKILEAQQQGSASAESLPEAGSLEEEAVTAVTAEEKQERVRADAAKAYKKIKKEDLKSLAVAKGMTDKGVKAELVTRLARSDAGLPSLEEPTALAPAAMGGAQHPADGHVTGPIGTLVVCPMSVISNWEGQLEEHVKEGALKVYAYHGGHRSQDTNFLASCDVVITTYDTLASDFLASGGEESFGAEGDAAGAKRKRRHGVLALGWHRVVLDEAHTIRNSKTRKHKACLALSTRHRWCLTGTPLQNKPEDIGALFSFLRLAPVSNTGVFTRAIARPIRSGLESGLARLRVLMKSVCLRRTKGILDNKLPPKVVEVHSVEMDRTHREAYDALYKSAQAAFRAALAVGESEVMSQYASVLECLLRLRQVCCAVSLVPQGRLQQAKKVLNQLSKDGPALGKEATGRLFAKLKGLLSQDEGAECAVCLEPVEEGDCRVIRGCGHGFCSRCLGAMCDAAAGSGERGGRNKCPLCRSPFTSADVVGGTELEAARKDATKEDSGAAAGVTNSEKRMKIPPKVAALLQSLHELRQSGRDKAVIFSQFTSFLDVIQPHLAADGFLLARIDGKMNHKQRQTELRRFAGKGGEEAEVMLASLTAAGTGINLTSANHCFICDPWWNGSVEEQAMDRVHRIGQTKPVRVVRMVSANSVENRILEIQDAKQALGKGALRKLSPEELRKTRMTDLRTIFES